MSLLELPKFKFGKEVTSKSVEAALKPQEYVNFKPGTIDLKLHSIEAMGEAKDPTWFKLKFFFVSPETVDVKSETKKKGDGTEFISKTAFDKDGNEVPSINEFSMIPTKSILYMCADGKARGFALQNLVNLLLGFGITITDFKKDIPALFSGDLSEMVGKTVSATLGYRGNRIIKIDDLFVIVDKADKPLTLIDSDDAETIENSFVSRDIAESSYMATGLPPLQKYLNILKFNPGKVVEVKDVKADESTSDWD